MSTHAAIAPETVLRSAGLRVTRPRLAVLRALAAAPHSAADAVLTAVRSEAEVSTQAVYDVLNALTAHGVVRRFQPAGSVARYELRTADNHHHLVCRGCGAVADVDCAVGEAPCLDPVTSGSPVPGFVVDEAEVTFWGLCAACSSHTADA
ncbi:Fur family transcriptional regulator [Nocardioides sp. CFH 31398]|uniref:Fur family transcriptional regulator n=1 Tax=Nocardioides sp. CFH 31398 TaxID=2919579 RepID=UPI001F0707D4|nr:transcriptional repressor [Nocardioides sp. CFH 31398]MCH1866803.1 transcriptional repressor [Nocardioides sp. CFH 31398]